MKRTILALCVGVALTSCRTQLNPSQDLVMATAWMQNAGEYQALTLQAFHLAKIQLDKILQEDFSAKPKAIVLDIDETVLDNSPYQAYQILNKKEFNENDWYAWTDLAAAQPLAGAVSFLDYTKSKGVEIFYVSNRVERERTSTLKNLQDKGFPFADNAHLILKTDTSSKTERRNKLAEKYNIVLYFGDNLSDFSDVYYRNNDDVPASQKVLRDGPLFGTKYIVLPNPMYGDWESALYKKNKNKKLNNSEVRMQSLHSFTPRH